jgi:PKD repeat protein
VSALGDLLDGTIGACLTRTLESLISFGVTSVASDPEDGTPAETSALPVAITAPNGESVAAIDGPFTTYEYVEADAFHYAFDASAGAYEIEIVSETEREVTVRSHGSVGSAGTIDAEYTATVSPTEPITLTATVPDQPDTEGSMREADAPAPIGSFENPPNDLDGDGQYEDINGDGVFDIVDVQALFTNLDGPVVRNNPDAFDFNDDGRVDVVDVQRLFDEL